MRPADDPRPGAASRAAHLLDFAPVLILAAIAGAGSFVHIRDTAAQHGQHGLMSWAIAISIDLTCVMAARERQRDRRTRRRTRRLSWPTLVLTGGVLLSVAANLDQARPDTWGRITAATPAAAFLVAVSMLERRTTPAQPADATVTTSAVVSHPAVRAVPVPEPQDRPATPVPAPGQAVSTLADFARRVAAEHHAAHGQAITRDVLRARLGVSNQLAPDLLRQIRTAPDTT